ncbi:MAG: hypothetical protein ACC707_16220, partial [Thiohalomonadales bacterium]
SGLVMICTRNNQAFLSCEVVLVRLSVSIIKQQSVRRFSRILLVYTAFFSTSSAYAVGVGIQANSLGLGVELTQSIYPKVNLRAGINAYSVDSDVTQGGNDYKQTIDLQSISALVDWHPFAGGFRITGGLLLNGTEVKLFSDSQQTFTIGNETYTSDNMQLSGLVSFRPVAPYLGIGWGSSPHGSGWSVTAELGVIYVGESDVKLDATGTATAEGSALPIDVTKDATFIENLILEESNLENEIDDLTVYPVVSLGVVYVF